MIRLESKTEICTTYFSISEPTIAKLRLSLKRLIIFSEKEQKMKCTQIDVLP